MVVVGIEDDDHTAETDGRQQTQTADSRHRQQTELSVRVGSRAVAAVVVVGIEDDDHTAETDTDSRHRQQTQTADSSVSVSVVGRWPQW